MRAVVVGAGVIGLMSAHALAHHGHAVTILAASFQTDTTSARAAASFKPSSVARAAPYRELLVASAARLAAWESSGFAGRVGIGRMIHVEASMLPLDERDYLDVMDDVEHLSAARGDEIPGGYPHAVRYRTWLFDVPITLPALQRHVVDDHGVVPEAATIRSLDDGRLAGARPDVVVNATGFGARELLGDLDLIPVKGQAVVVDRSVWDGTISISADGLYLYPRSGDILVGGTMEEGVFSEHVDPGARQLILAGNARVAPGLLRAEPIAERAGLRPYRASGIRLEVEVRTPCPVVHAYGHGGSGWTLGPGTGDWVAAAVDRLA